MLDLTSFQDAVAQLEDMHSYAQSPAVKADLKLSTYMRTAVIKGFEYSYELAHKFMERFIETYGPRREPDMALTYRELLRHAHEYGLIANVNAWLLYREKRNVTSHGYNASKAEEIFAVIPDFLRDARFTLKAIAQRQKEQQ